MKDSENPCNKHEVGVEQTMDSRGSSFRKQYSRSRSSISRKSKRGARETALIIIEQQRRYYREELPKVAGMLGNPPVGSALHRDLAWAKDHKQAEVVEGLSGVGYDAILNALMAVEQQLESLSMILQSKLELPLPLMGCARSIHESILMVCWLSDHEASSEERSIRSASTYLGSVQGGIPAAQSLSKSHPQTEMMLGLRSRAIAHVESLGFDVNTNRSGMALNVRLGSHVANVVPKTSDQSEAYAPKSHSAWIINSGAVHAQQWLTLSVARSWVSTITMTMIPLLELSEILMESIFRHVGLDATSHRKRTRLQLVSIVRSEQNDVASELAYMTSEDHRWQPLGAST